MTAHAGGDHLAPEIVTAFADGELSRREREAVQAHLARCAPCRAELADERRAKHAVQSLTSIPVAPELVDRLLAIPTAGAAAGPGATVEAAARFRGACLEPEVVTAFADGELGHRERESVQAHLAHCAQCRADVADERQTKRSVQALTDVGPSPALVDRLIAIGTGTGTGAADPHADHDELQAVRTSRAARAADRSGGAGGRRRAPRPMSLFTGAASVAVFFVGAAAFLGTTGEAPAPTRPAGAAVVPAADRFAVEHAASSLGGGFGEGALTTVSTASLVTPSGLEPTTITPAGADSP
jgi:anti-sigma factor RsiW